MIQNAFVSLETISDQLTISIIHIGSMRIVVKGMQDKLKKSIMKLLFLRKKQQRKNIILNFLKELKKLRNGIKDIKTHFDRDEISPALEIYKDLSSMSFGKIIKRFKLVV